MNIIEQLRIAVPSLLVLLIVTGSVFAQSGSRVGINDPATAQELSELSPQVAKSYIVVDGSAVLRVKPTDARVILAVTTEATTASECNKLMSQKMDQLRQAWVGAGLADENIVEDFISVLPRYDFEIKEIEGSRVAQEKKVGYLMQTNVHLAVKADEGLMKKVIDTAFANEVTDIIGFDLWSKKLDEKKKEARAMAIKVAKEKSDVLLNGLFEKRPPVINVKEKTKVYFPTSLYRSFNNVSSAQYGSSYASSRNISRILLPRPKNTYYHGHVTHADRAPSDLQMRAEISVESHVHIYFESPVAKSFNASRKD